MNELAHSIPPESFGRYLLYPAIARGGMASVHTARLVGAEGFSRLVAAKRLHPQFAEDPDFVTMFHDEACIASHIHHPNVVPVLDVVMAGRELILVMEYVHGVPLSQLMKAAQTSGAPLPLDIAVALLTGVLAGLHAAHEVTDEAGQPLDIVHRDVSPQNVMVSVDGIPRLLDFGIAKARTSAHHTRDGVFKGKLAYMAPEQLRMEGIDRTADLYATGVLAWEMLVNRRIYDGRSELAFVTAVMNGSIPRVTEALADSRRTTAEARWKELLALDAIVARAMSQSSTDRFATAAEMQRALLDVRPGATSMEVADWVRAAGAEFLDQSQRVLTANEESFRRKALFAPSSGTQRTVGSLVGALSLGSTDSLSIAGYASSSTRTSAPPSVTFPSRAPGDADDSEVFRRALGASSVPRSVAAMRSSRLVTWVAASALVLAGLAGGFVRESMVTSRAAASAVRRDSAPAVDFSSVPSKSDSAESALAITSARAPLAALSATPTSPPTAPASAPLPKPNHWAPRAAGPVRVTPSAPSGQSPSAVASPASAAASVSSVKVDCNPPFFFEGTKKVFKPSCL